METPSIKRSDIHEGQTYGKHSRWDALRYFASHVTDGAREKSKDGIWRTVDVDVMIDDIWSEVGIDLEADNLAGAPPYVGLADDPISIKLALERRLYDYDNELLGISEVAAEIGLAVQSVRDLRSKGKMPEPYKVFSGSPVWVRKTIREWNEGRK